MMSHVPVVLTDAAYEAHMAAAESLKGSLGRDVHPRDTVQTIAEAYGDALAIYAGSGAQPHQIDAINRMAQRAYTTIIINHLGWFRVEQIEQPSASLSALAIEKAEQEEQLQRWNASRSVGFRDRRLCPEIEKLLQEVEAEHSPDHVVRETVDHSAPLGGLRP